MHVPTSLPAQVLLLHPSPGLRPRLAEAIRRAGFSCYPAEPDAPLADLFRERDFPLAAVGMEADASCGETPAWDAVAAIRQIHALSPATQVVAIVPASVDLTTCCRAVSLGVAAFVEVQADGTAADLERRLRQALERYHTACREGQEIHTRQVFDETGFAGQSRAMAELLLKARRVARISDAPVLIYGESGTGKQLLAEAIHRLDPKRSGRPFLTVNCAAVSAPLAESALFGHCRGAFTGATQDREGYFRAAHGGTLLLDEISEMPLEIQARLLRVLQEGRILPVGADREISVDVRVIAASNRRLEALVAEGRFRLDLYQRLNVVLLEIPPLRERREDVPPLIRFFLRRYASYYPHPIEHVDPRVEALLADIVGEGNVRELENIVRQILAFKKSGSEITLADIPPHILRARQDAIADRTQISPALAEVVRQLLQRGPAPLARILSECERLILQQALEQADGSYQALARRLGITRRTLYNKLRKYRLTRPAARER